MNIQIAPYCEGVSKEKQEQDEFYVGTAEQILIINNNVYSNNYTIRFNLQEHFVVNSFK